MRALLQTDNVSIQFHTSQSTVQAVRGVSFSLYEGETLAIVGESGCGKSVLCKSILRLLPHSGAISNGKLLFQGQDLTALSEKAMDRIRGREIAMVFQDPMTSLNPTMSVGKQIMEVILQHEKVSKKEAKARALFWMETVGLDHPEARFAQMPHHFSGGMRQRAVIAIALACRPKVLIADEPTTALDVTIQAQILELLQRLQKQFSLSILFITHDLSVVAKMADRVAVMYAGKIVEAGLAEEIFRDPKHPYTWGLLGALPGRSLEGQPLYSIPGMPPDLAAPPVGDAFAQRNPYALVIDYQEQPPMFAVTPTHSAATWLLDSRAPEVPCPLAREVKNHG